MELFSYFLLKNRADHMGQYLPIYLFFIILNYNYFTAKKASSFLVVGYGSAGNSNI